MPGGLNLFHLRFRPGDNTVDPKAWADASARLDARFVAGLTAKPKGSMPPYLEILGDAAEAPAPEPEPAPELTLVPDPPPAPSMPAKEKIALIEAATSYEQLEQLEENEHRKTVLTALYKRAAVIDKGERKT